MIIYMIIYFWCPCCNVGCAITAWNGPLSHTGHSYPLFVFCGRSLEPVRPFRRRITSPKGGQVQIDQRKSNYMAGPLRESLLGLFIWNSWWTYFSSFPYPKLYWTYLSLNKTTKDISVFTCKTIHMFFFFFFYELCFRNKEKSEVCNNAYVFEIIPVHQWFK